MTDRGRVFVLLGPPTYVGRRPIRPGDDTADPSGGRRAFDARIDGAIVVLMDIDAMKTSLRQSDEGRAFSEAIVNTVREPLVVLGRTLVVKHVNECFVKRF